MTIICVCTVLTDFCTIITEFCTAVGLTALKSTNRSRVTFLCILLNNLKYYISFISYTS